MKNSETVEDLADERANEADPAWQHWDALTDEEQAAIEARVKHCLSEIHLAAEIGSKVDYALKQGHIDEWSHQALRSFFRSTEFQARLRESVKIRIGRMAEELISSSEERLLRKLVQEEFLLQRERIRKKVIELADSVIRNAAQALGVKL